MSRRWRILIRAGVAMLALVAGVVTWQWGRHEDKRALSFTFVGFTNKNFAFAGTVPSTSIILPIALVQVKNNERVPILLLPSIPTRDLPEDKHFVVPGGAPCTLAPGASTVIEVGPSGFPAAWWTSVRYQRQGASERLYAQVAKLPKSSTQSWLFRFLRAAAVQTVESGWITNRY